MLSGIITLLRFVKPVKLFALIEATREPNSIVSASVYPLHGVSAKLAYSGISSEPLIVSFLFLE